MNMPLELNLIWFLAGVVLLTLEMISGTFVLIFISFGAFAAGVVATFLSNQLFTQALACVAVSVAGTLLLRKPIQTRFLKTTLLSADIGKEIKISQNVPPHQTTRISYQGTDWYAINLDPEALKEGDRVCIVGIDGNTLLIRKVN
jgi:membrane protein implicated in regulation of membrane protease activity